MGDDAGGGELKRGLEAIGARIERLSLDPAGVRAPFARLARPLLRVVGYRPRPRVEAAEALLEALGDPGVPGEALGPRVKAAARELSASVKAAERACVVHGGLPPGEAAWLHRLYALVSRAAQAAEAPGDRAARRVAAAAEGGVVAPLALEGRGSRGGSRGEGEADTPAPGSKEAQRIALELLAIDHIIEAAQAETSFLERRRRLLEAARALLLDAAAALPLEARGVEQRRRAIAAGIVRIDRLEAAGLSAGVGLLHQARGALSRGDTQRLHAALVALEGAAITAGDARAAGLAGEALDALWGGDGWTAPEGDVERCAREALGGDVADAVRRGYEAARAGLRPPGEGASRVDREVHELALAYLAPGCEEGAFAAALAVDGCFDVGAALAPVRVTEIELRARAVPYPTEEMILLPARGVEDLPSAIIEDPRAILPSLAMGRLLARRFVRREPVRRQRTRLVGEVRVYLLDGSTSMLEGGGARARVRDAILLGELATLIRRFDAPVGGRGVRVVLFYRYFTKQLGALGRVESGPAAVAAIGDVLGQPRSGGTDIEQALLSSFALIREQGQRDPDLARAQIVLVTDGEAPVREEVVQAAREEAGAIPIQVSVIALGEENPALRALVARQRAQGERAFYHHVGDAALLEMCEGRLDRGPSAHAAAGRGGEAAALRGELEAVLEELAALEGEAARKEGRDRDHRAVAARFERWFPRPEAKAPPPEAFPRLPAEGTAARADLEAAQIVLATVAEVTRELGGAPLARRADAIEILERLLPDAGLSPGRYRAALRDQALRLAPALAEIHALVRDGSGPPSP